MVISGISCQYHCQLLFLQSEVAVSCGFKRVYEVAHDSQESCSLYCTIGHRRYLTFYFEGKISPVVRDVLFLCVCGCVLVEGMIQCVIAGWLPRSSLSVLLHSSENIPCWQRWRSGGNERSNDEHGLGGCGCG